MTMSFFPWVGGKVSQYAKLAPLIPQTRVYVEAFGGAGGMLLNRPRMPVEVYNDLDSGIVNLFEVVRTPDLFDRFRSMVEWTLYARKEYEKALRVDTQNPEVDACVRAWAVYVTQWFGFSGRRMTNAGSFSQTPQRLRAWPRKSEELAAFHRRLQGVLIECRDALELVETWDSNDVTFYLDPPYVMGTRGDKNYYAVELSDDYHTRLVETILRCQGNVVLSGYAHAVYEPLLENGWTLSLYTASAWAQPTEAQKQGVNYTQERTEAVYRNPQACDFGFARTLDFDSSPTLTTNGVTQAVDVYLPTEAGG